jgi:hypothetical protein
MYTIFTQFSVSKQQSEHFSLLLYEAFFPIKQRKRRYAEASLLRTQRLFIQNFIKI